MRLRQIVFFVCTIFLLTSVATAQTVGSDEAAEKAKKKKEIDERVVQMLDRTVAEANALRLPANRAVVYAMSGDLYWRFDSKRSRELFRTAAAEISTYNQEFEREKRDRQELGIPEGFDLNDPRVEVLSLIAMHDADLALELLIPTRSASLAEAMARAPATDARANLVGSGTGAGMGVGDSGGAINQDRMRASQEFALEQRLITQAAFSDPDRAAKAIKDSLAKGISPAVITLLQVVYRKDEKQAADLAGEVVGRITAADLAKNSDDLSGATNFLQFFVRPVAGADAKAKVFSFSDTQVKDVANKLASTFLQSGTTPALTSALTRSLVPFEKILPEKIVLLKQRDALNRKAAASAARPGQPNNRPWEPNMSPEDIIAAVAKLPNARERISAYQFAASKIRQIADETRVKRIIDSIPDKRTRATALEQFEATKISRLAWSGGLDEARRLIVNLTNRRTKVQQLVTLATQFQRKGGEKEIETARSIMIEARSLANPRPEDEDELGDLMEIIRGYAVVEPQVAFHLIEPIIDQFNEMIQATAVLSKYNKRDRSFEKGELVIRVNGNGGLLPFRYIHQLQLLGKADLERMSTMIDRFQRGDSRTIMRLYVLQGYLRNTQPPPPLPAM